MVNLIINLNDEHDPDKVEMLKSAAFVPGKTLPNTQLFLDTEIYPDHHAARFSLIEHSLYTSTGLNNYLSQLAKNAPLMDMLVTRCKKLVLILAYMPDWMSSSNDKTPILGYWKKCNTVRPNNYLIWERLVRQTAQWLTAWLGRGCEIYIEVWNEPDLDYWQDDYNSLFTLYGYSAKAIKAIDQRFKVGGMGCNWWMKDDINENLIAICGKHNLPLDFVSWHQFASPASHLTDAIGDYDTAIEAAGLSTKPEYVITEYNTGPQVRDTPLAVPALASMILTGPVEEKITHLFSAWEDFSAGAKIEDYGLLTQAGERKPVYDLYKMLDELSRTSRGIRLYRETGLYVLSCQAKEDGRHVLVLWNPSLENNWAFALIQVEGAGEIEDIFHDSNSACISVGNAIGLVVKPYAVARVEFTY